jgi:hypothetical protein
MVFIKKVKLARNFRRLLKVVHCFLITSFLYFSEEVSPLLERKDNCDQKLASDSSGLSGGFRGIGRGFGL